MKPSAVIRERVSGPTVNSCQFYIQVTCNSSKCENLPAADIINLPRLISLSVVSKVPNILFFMLLRAKRK